MHYETIFFDLDHTLWDFNTNSFEALTELSQKYKLTEKGVNSVNTFIEEYLVINDRLWVQYRNGLITKEELRYKRFSLALQKYGIADSDLATAIGNDYIAISPYKTNLFPHAIEALEYLSEKYPLHIITNGFEEVQHLKLKNCKLDIYFTEVITSERSGFQKPDARMFEFSLTTTNAKQETSLMIGDSLEADIQGARNSGIRQIYFNPGSAIHSEKVTHEIKNLNELMTLL
ncbi:MAG TPA: YjjG family noncanonical pyrimidine nucleotidase [Bacteroidia bacterium]|jgi:putative hydrolase of the HAD superfamily